MDAREFKVIQHLQTQLSYVSRGAKVPVPSASSSGVTSSKPGSSVAATEKVQHSGLLIEIPTRLAQCSSAQFLSVLQRGWALLSPEEQKSLASLLPPTTHNKTPNVPPAVLTMDPFYCKLFFGHPVVQFHARLRCGLLNPRVQQWRLRLPSLAAREAQVARDQIRESASRATRARALGARMQHSEGNYFVPTVSVMPDDLGEAESVESEFTGSVVTAGHKSKLQIRKRRLQKQQNELDKVRRRPLVMMAGMASEPSSMGPGVGPTGGASGGPVVIISSIGSGLGVPLETASTPAAVLSRSTKKTQSRVSNGTFLAAFSSLIRIREILRKNGPVTAQDLSVIMSTDQYIVMDPVEGLSALQLARLCISFLFRTTECHKVSFGPYVNVIEGGKLQWIDDSKSEELDVLLDLEAAERLLRYAASRNIVDLNSGIISPSHIKDLKYMPVSVRRLPPDLLNEFHRQERERFDLSQSHSAYTYRLGNVMFIVAPQPKSMTKTARKHHCLIDDRPPSVTMQDIVRDAVARLPQGVGTKSDLIVLVQDSQYVNPDVSNQILGSTISDSLDRLSASNDPAVAFHAPSRLWSYLHRKRGPGDFSTQNEDDV